MLKDIKSTPVNIFIQLAILSIFVIFFSSLLSYIQSRITVIIEQKIQKRMQDELLDKHFLRKHGENAYYGQKK